MKLLMCYIAVALSIVVPNQVIGMSRLPNWRKWMKGAQETRLHSTSAEDERPLVADLLGSTGNLPPEHPFKPTEEGADQGRANEERAAAEAAELRRKEIEAAKRIAKEEEAERIAKEEEAERLALAEKKAEDERLAAEKERAERNTLEKVIPSESWVFFEKARLFWERGPRGILASKITYHEYSNNPDDRPAQNQELGEECIELARKILLDKYAELHPYERIWTLSIAAAANEYLIPLSKDGKTYLDFKPMDERTTLELQVVRKFRPRLSELFQGFHGEYAAISLSAIYKSPNKLPENIELGELLERFALLRKFAGLKAKNCPRRRIETEGIVLEHLWKQHLPQEEVQAQELINALRRMFKGSIVPEWGGDYPTALLKHLYKFPSFTQEQLKKSLEDPDFLRDIFEPYAKKDLIKLLDMPAVKQLEPGVYASLRNYCQNTRGQNTMECLMKQTNKNEIFQLVRIEVLLHPDEGKKVIEIVSKEPKLSFIKKWFDDGRGKNMFRENDALFDYSSWIFKKYPFEFQILYGRYLANKMEEDRQLYEPHNDLIGSLRSLPLDPNGITDDEIKNFYDVVIKTTSNAHTNPEYAMEFETLLVVLGAYERAPKLLLKHMDENMEFRNEMFELSQMISGYKYDYKNPGENPIPKEDPRSFSLTTSPDILLDFCETILQARHNIWEEKLDDSVKGAKLKDWEVKVKPRSPF